MFKSDNLAVGAKGKVYFEVRIDESALGTTVLNKAIIDIGEGSNRITYHSNTTKTPVNEKDSFIENIYLFENEIIDYTIGYEFPFGAEKLVISDVIPTNTKYVAGSITGTGADDSAISGGTGTLKWEIAGNEGDKGFVSFKVKVDEGIAAGVEIKNKAKQEYFNNANIKILDKDTNETVNKVDDDIKKIVDAPANIGVGDIISYSLDFENFDTVNLDLTVKDVIPSGTSFVENSIEIYKADGVTPWDNNDGIFNYTYNESTKTLELSCANLSAAAKGIIEFSVKVEKEAVGSVINNVAEYELGNNKYKSNYVKTPVNQNKVSVVGNGEEALKPGGEITYYVGYRNTENSPRDIIITDIIPTDTTYVTGSATGEGVDESGIINGTGTLKWTISNVAPNQSGLVTFKVIVNNNANAGAQIENEAEITIGTNAPAMTNKTIDIVNPKSSSITHANPAYTNNYVYTGDKLTYNIKYVNNTLNPRDIIITDEIPHGTVLDSIPAGATGYGADGLPTLVLNKVVKLEWIINVAPNATGSVTFDVVVTARDGSILNEGYVQVGYHNPRITNQTIDKFEPKKPIFTIPDKYLVTFLDCKGETVKIEWVKHGESATPPIGHGTYEGYINVSSHRDLKPIGCGIKFNKGYKIPKTGQTDNDLIWYITLGMGCVLLGLIKKRNLLKNNY